MKRQRQKSHDLNASCMVWQSWSAATLLTCIFSLFPFAQLEAQTNKPDAAKFAAVARLIKSNCMLCHDADTREAGIDLTPLLKLSNSSYGKYTQLWVKLEHMVSSGKMPPKSEEALSKPEIATIKKWFHQSFVMRNGKSHIGSSPLRRLTRYELERTLEDVLAIKLKAPYSDTLTGQIELSKIQTLVPSDIRGESGFDNDAHRMEKLNPPIKEIADAVHFALLKLSENPEAMQIAFGRKEISKNAPVAEIKPIISKFLLRAHRGNRTKLKEYTDIYSRLFEKHQKEFKDTMKSLLFVLEMILVSPEFLYRLEETKDLDTPYPVTGIELATRLSYFLWSTAPDEELVRLGQDGSLLKDDVLKSQVARMLNSPKRLALSESFAGQWLGFEDLLSNSEYFLNERWNRESYDEVLFFFDELIKTNKSFLELVQSDWLYKRASVVNKGRGYRRIDAGTVKSVYADVLSNRQSKSKNKGKKRRNRYDPPVLVKRKNDREGGIITSAAVMRLTASKSRTSPIRRGVWVLSTVIGRQLEPPPNIPSLEEAREALIGKENPSVADIIKQHVSKAQCVACHKAIDPLGLGLENYASTGRWRTRYPDKAAIESKGVMPNGKAFRSPREMKQLLLELYQDEITKNFVTQMFAYALGRKMEPFDRIAIDEIVSKVKQDDYRISAVIEQIVLSKQFRNRQDR